MKTGKLSNADKGTIIHLLQESKTVAEIASKLDRSEDVINKYISEVRSVVEEKPEEIVVTANPKVINEAINQLRANGLSNISINSKINKILKALTPEQIQNLNAPALVADCMRMVNIHDVMINKTGGGNPGVAIMTEAGSERGDNVKAQPKQNPHVYKIY